MGRMGIFMGLVAAGAAGEHGVTRYFFHWTVMHNSAKRERTQKMVGTDWNAYIPGIRASKEWLAEQEEEDVFITLADGLRLHGTSFPCEGSKWAVVCFHGYTSGRLNDFSSIARLYLEKGFNLMVTDERAHRKSKGTYIRFGRLDHHDALGWIRYVISRLGQGRRLMPHGISMGGATVLMTTGLILPPQIRATASDCISTSAWGVLSHVLGFMYHAPVLPVVQIAGHMTREEAGYGLNECNARDGTKRARILIPFIHGDKDAFMPCSMVYDLYNACRSPKSFLVISGVNHAEIYYKDTENYEDAVDQLTRQYLDH